MATLARPDLGLDLPRHIPLVNSVSLISYPLMWSWGIKLGRLQAGARRFRREANQNKYPLRKMCRRIGAVGVSSTIAGVPLYFACFL